MCLADEPAQLLGIENLVCEVQLVLDAFEELIKVPIFLQNQQGLID